VCAEVCPRLSAHTRDYRFGKKAETCALVSDDAMRPSCPANLDFHHISPTPSLYKRQAHAGRLAAVSGGGSDAFPARRNPEHVGTKPLASRRYDETAKAPSANYCSKARAFGLMV